MTRLEIAVALICSPSFGNDIKGIFDYAERILEEEQQRKGHPIQRQQRKGYPIQSKFVPVEPNKKDDIPF